MTIQKETETMKVNDLFETKPLLTGRTQIDTALGYDTDDFEVSTNNIVSLKNKTSYLSIPGAAFLPQWTDSGDEAFRWPSGKIELDATINDGIMYVPIYLPHNAIITEAVVYGSSTGDTWTLKRATINGPSATTLTTAAIETANTSITNPTIDNSTYFYFIEVTGLTAGAEIHGARIKYTTDYI